MDERGCAAAEIAQWNGRALDVPDEGIRVWDDRCAHVLSFLLTILVGLDQDIAHGGMYVSRLCTQLTRTEAEICQFEAEMSDQSLSTRILHAEMPRATRQVVGALHSECVCCFIP